MAEYVNQIDLDSETRRSVTIEWSTIILFLSTPFISTWWGSHIQLNIRQEFTSPRFYKMDSKHESWPSIGSWLTQPQVSSTHRQPVFTIVDNSM